MEDKRSTLVSSKVIGLRKVLVDSSVIISALISNRGASYYCLISAKDKGYQLVISEFILKELLDVIERKFPNLLLRLFEILILGEILVVKNPNKKELKPFKNLIEKKDVPILASAIKEKADFLLTLDKEFLKQEVIDFASQHGLTILTPKDLIKKLNF
jgi:putative PIN family toxin of toxin-antitoxin system